MQKTYELQRKKRTEDIIQKTKEILIKKGFAGTSMQEIANVLCISRQTLYKYYKNIEEIAYDIQINVFYDMEKYFNENIFNTEEFDVKKDPFKKIERSLNLYFEYLELYTDNIMFTLLFDVHFKNQPTHAKQKDYIKYIQELNIFEKNLYACKEVGLIRQDLDIAEASKIMMNILMAMSQKIALRGRFLEEEQLISKDTIISEVKKMLLQYIRK